MPPLEEREARTEMVRVCRLVYERSYSTGADGNVTVRLSGGRLLATPSGVHKGFLEPADLVVVDVGSGRPLQGGEPTSELPMHLAIYRDRPDVHAVVHAHPIAAVACSLAGLDLEQIVVPEVIFGVGRIVMVPYSTPTTEDVPAAVSRHIATCDALVLARHGTGTVGPTLIKAFARLETVEHTARIVTLASQLGHLQPLPPEEVARLRRIVAGQGAAAEPMEAVIARATAEVIRRLSAEGLS